MHLIEHANDPAFWRGVREKECFRRFREDLFRMWERHAENVPIYALKYSDYRLFAQTGNRSVYEAAYFTRRQARDAAVLLALLYPEEEKYIVRLQDEIFAICDEYSWCLPAHQPQPDKNCNSNVDLFASETAFALAEIDALLGDRLEPLIRSRIRAEIERRVLTTMEETPGRYDWETGRYNWTAVCMGSIGCTLMLLFPERFDAFRPRIDRAMECYLSGFADDGVCTEGSSYWYYGFGFFVTYADMVRRFTQGKIDYFKREKVRTVATFIQKMYLSEGTGVSFADAGSTEITYHIGLLHRLKSEYPDDVSLPPFAFGMNGDTEGRFALRLRSALWFDEAAWADTSPMRLATEWMPDAQWLVRRCEKYGFAAKAGHNGEPHNHNDVGTFIFARNGQQLLCDIGSGEYTRQYFSAARYTIFECASSGHNLPLIDGKEQLGGGSHTAKDVVYQADDATLRMDLSPAYALEELPSLRRTFHWTEDGVTVCDAFDYTGTGTLTERLIAGVEPQAVADGTLRVGSALLRFDPAACRVTWENRLAGRAGMNKRSFWLLDFALNPDARNFRLAILCEDTKA